MRTLLTMGFVIGLCYSQLSAQPMFYSLQAKLARAACGNGGDRHPFSMLSNPSFLEGSGSVSWAFGGEQRFLAPGWNELAAALILPARKGTWGFFAGYEGLVVSGDQLLSITHARALSTQTRAGVSIGINKKKAAFGPVVVSPVAAAGLSFLLSNEWRAGVSYSRFAQKVSPYPEAEALSLLHLTLSYNPGKKLTLVATVIKQSGQATESSIALCYRPSPKAGLRIGFSGSPSLCWFGLQLGIGKKVSVQVYSGLYSLVGVSNGLSIFSSSDAMAAVQKPNDP